MLKKLKFTSELKELKKMSERQILSKQQMQDIKNIEKEIRVIEEDLSSTDMTDENSGSYTTNSLTTKRAESNARVILKVIQLLCENHNPNLQNILRQQIHEDNKQKLNSFDICSYLSKNLEYINSMFNDQTFEVSQQLVDTLIEIIQGPCKQN